MSNINKKGHVERQYSDDKNLSVRINLHAKHSTNKQGFSNWLWEHYNFPENCQILELGCGNGEQWKSKIDTLSQGCRVILSDFSEGMVNSVREKYKKYELFSFQQIDIQDTPFQSDTFDAVIANHMLYHIPDLSKALSEVRRVLKVGGVFYSSTISNGGMQLFLHESFKRFDPNTKAFAQQFSFTLQNGYELLCAYFRDVKRADYEDSLSITETKDLMYWIESTITLNSCCMEQNMDNLYDYFENIRKRGGAINIPKESGLFISKK